jgi:hypothetical protein
MSERENVVVPKGATLSLNWGIDATALVDAASGVDVVGPAVVRAKNDQGEMALMLESGTAQAHVVHSGEVATAYAVTRGTNSVWVVAMREGGSRVKVARGEVEVRTSAVSEVVRAGETLDALADGRLVAPAGAVAATTLLSPPANVALSAASSFEPSPAMSDAERRAAANEALRRGDSDRATGALRDLLQASKDTGTRERAGFELAELELARGKTEDARSLLAPLLDAADPSLAGDAAFLLSGSMSTPNERLEILDRYLAKPRISPYLEQAQVERARALLEAGRENEALAVVRALRAEQHLPLVARAGLARLERALQRAP